MKKWKPYLVGAAIALAVGGLSGLLSAKAMENYAGTAIKAPLSPPAWLFPAVWTVLYILMGIGAAEIWQKPHSRDRSKSLNLFVLQLVVNFFWSLLFFNAAAYGFAAIWLGLLLFLVLWMCRCFAKVDHKAAKMQIPYLLWLCFALYLNISVYFLNK